MKRIRLLVLSLAASALLGTGLAQESFEKPAAQALLRVANAMGMATEEYASPAQLLQDFAESGILDRTTVDLVANAIYGSAVFTSDSFAVLLVDALNGTAPAPETIEDARALLEEVGIVLPPSGEPIDMADLAEVFTDPDFADAVAEGYLIPASPINTAGN